MGSNSDGFASLTARHGCKCLSDETVSVEDCLIAVSNAVGAQNILSASRMNKAVVIFLRQTSMVNDLVEHGLSVKDVFVPVLPLSNPSKKVVLSNVPPFIPNDTLERMLVRYGKLMGPIKMMSLGLKNPELKHIMSFRRQTYMILNAEFQNLEVALKLTLDGKDYTIFIAVDSMKCFRCGKQGHLRQTCPLNMEAEKEKEGNSVVEQGGLNTAVDNNGAESIGNEQPAETAVLPNSGEGSNVLEQEIEVTDSASVIGTHVHGSVKGDEELNVARVVSGLKDPEEQNELENLQVQGSSLVQCDIDLLSQRTDDLSENDSECECPDTGEEHDVNSQGNSAGNYFTSHLKSPFYTVQQLNDFLDATKNQRKPNLEKYFPDLELFVESGAIVMRKATLEELDKPKRYRLKKLVSTVRKSLNSRLKRR